MRTCFFFTFELTYFFLNLLKASILYYKSGFIVPDRNTKNEEKNQNSVAGEMFKIK